MLIWNPSKLTTAGKALLAKAQAGQASIQITKAMTGSGSYSGGENLESRTALKEPKQTFPIQSKTITAENTVVLKIAITNKSEDTQLNAGYEIKEFGIFAKDSAGGNEVLYSIATASTSDYMPAYNGIIPSVINMSYYLEVANAANVTINSAGALALQEDLEALEERVTRIEQNKLKIFGVRRKAQASSTTWERFGDSVGMVCKAAVGNGTVQNDLMKEYPYSAMKPCNVAEDASVNAYMGEAGFQWDGSNGDVMLEVPLFYSRRWFETDADGVKWEYRAVSPGPVNGLKVDRMFIDGGQITEKVYLPIFNGSFKGEDQTKLVSCAGAVPVYNKTRAQFRTLCTAKGDHWYLDDVWAMHALDTLFLVMFANSNAQAVLGQGLTAMPYDNAANVSLQENEQTNHITINKDWASHFTVGQLISIGTGAGNSSVCADRTVTQIKDSTEVESASEIHFDGEPVDITTASKVWSCCQKTGATIDMQSPNGRVEGVDGRTAVRFLWIEDWFGNGWQFRDGDNIQKWQHYYCNKRSSYADKTYTGDYFKVGYEASHTNGYVSEFGFDPEWPEIEIAVGVTGSTSTFFADYYYQAEGGEVVLSGGYVSHGGHAGPFLRSCNYGVGYSPWNILARPQCRK
nr:phage tail protein [uncultured Dysosmobacter sp.]